MEGETTQNAEAAGDSQRVAVDVEQLIRSMKGKLGGLNLQPRPQPTICRVMRSVRREDAAAYDPMIISIGPFHKDKPEVQAMGALKWRFLRELLLRCPQTDLHDSTAAISAQVKEIRGQYSEEFPETADADFVEMLVLDGSFILELMFKLIEYQMRVVLPGGKWVLSNVMNDLLLLENQIPFSVLETLYKALDPRPFDFCTFRGLAFLSVVTPGGPPELVPTGIENREFHHLLHFYHYCHVLQCKREEAPPRSPWLQAAIRRLRIVRKTVSTLLFQLCFRIIYLAVSGVICRPLDQYCNHSKGPPLAFIIPSITKLKDAGVRFRRKEFWTTESYSILKITFSPEGVFEIPFLSLHGGSNSKFRNLIAFEQNCHDLSEDEQYYTCYCLLMAYLIDTEGDVDVLEKHGIVSNFMGNAAEVAKLFDKVCTGATIHHWSNCYLRVLEDVTRYCTSDLHKWRARLVHDYFGNPWASISVVAAAVLLALTIVQTHYTVYAYYHPRS